MFLRVNSIPERNYYYIILQSAVIINFVFLPNCPCRHKRIREAKNNNRSQNIMTDIQGDDMIGIIFALLAGLLMSVQGVFNTRVMDSSNMWATNSWVHLTAFIACIFAWFITGREDLLSVFNVDNKLYLLGGVIGAFITFTVIRGISDLGPAYATMLILLAQLVTSCLIEAIGLFGTEKISLEWSKLIGVVLMIAGIIVIKK